MKKWYLLILLIGIVLFSSVVEAPSSLTHGNNPPNANNNFTNYQMNEVLEQVSDPICNGYNCYFDFKIKNPLNNQLTLNPSSLYFWYLKGDENIKLKNNEFTYYELNDVQRLASVQTGGGYWEEEIIGQYPNGSNIYNYNYLEPTYNLVAYDTTEWANIIPNAIQIPSNSEKTLRVEVNFEPMIGENSIDWKIAIDHSQLGYYEPEWVWFNNSKSVCYPIEFSTSSGLSHTEPIYLHITNESDVANITFVAHDITSGTNYSMYAKSKTDNFTEITIVDKDCDVTGNEIPYGVVDNTSDFDLPDFSLLVDSSHTPGGTNDIYLNSQIQLQLHKTSGGGYSLFENSTNVDYLNSKASNNGISIQDVNGYVIGFDQTMVIDRIVQQPAYTKVFYNNNEGEPLNRGNITVESWHNYSYIKMDYISHLDPYQLSFLLTDVDGNFNTSYVSGNTYIPGNDDDKCDYSTTTGISNGKGVFGFWNDTNDFIFNILFEPTITQKYRFEDSSGDIYTVSIGDPGGVGGCLGGDRYNIVKNTRSEVFFGFEKRNGLSQSTTADNSWTKFDNPLTYTFGSSQLLEASTPIFTLPTPINNTWLNKEYGDPTFNFSSTASFHIKYWVQSSINVSNLTESLVNTNFSNSGVSTLFTFDVQDNQTWYYNIKSGNDTLGHVENKTSETRTFRTDFTLPILYLDSITNTTSSLSACDETISLNYSSIDENINSCTYAVYNNQTIEIANTTVSNCLNTTFTSPTGCGVTYTVILNVNDSANNVNTTINNYLISATPGGTTIVDGGGGGGSPSVAPINCDESGLNWTLQSIRGTGSYQAQISENVKRTFTLQAKNREVNNVTLKFSCLEDVNTSILFCPGINISKETILLPQNIEKFEDIIISITPPNNVQTGESYYPSILVQDSNEICSGTFSFKLTATPFGKLWRTYTIPLSGLGESVEDVEILALFFIIPLSFLMFFIIFYLFSRVILKSPPLAGLFGFVASIGTFGLFIFIL